jgi:hypothetical protein
MQKTILTLLGSAVLMASTVQIAAAAEHHHARKVYRPRAPVSAQYRDSNAYYTAPAPWVRPGWPPHFEDEALSPPAGR